MKRPGAIASNHGTFASGLFLSRRAGTCGAEARRPCVNSEWRIANSEQRFKPQFNRILSPSGKRSAPRGRAASCLMANGEWRIQKAPRGAGHTVYGFMRSSLMGTAAGRPQGPARRPDGRRSFPSFTPRRGRVPSRPRPYDTTAPTREGASWQWGNNHRQDAGQAGALPEIHSESESKFPAGRGRPPGWARVPDESGPSAKGRANGRRRSWMDGQGGPPPAAVE